MTLGARLQGIFISRVSGDGPSREAGLQVGDKVLSVNENSLVDADHHRAVEVLKAAGNDVTMVVQRPHEAPLTSSSSSKQPDVRQLENGDVVNGAERDTARVEVRLRRCFCVSTGTMSNYRLRVGGLVEFFG